ncbi:MAG: hypothetical protein L7S56_06545 [Candidatus Poseidonia sp.]|nr:hypothetical protein [Poseidonia sp.]
MGLHHITWRATVSAVANEAMTAEMMAWLIGDSDDVNMERTSSYHGSPIHIVTATTHRKSPAFQSLSRLGTATLKQLAEEMEQRLDENNTLHIRLDLDSCLNGDIRLADESSRATVKGQTKIEVYPGQSLHEECRILLLKAATSGTHDGN